MLNLTAFGDATSLFNVDGRSMAAMNSEHEHPNGTGAYANGSVT